MSTEKKHICIVTTSFSGGGAEKIAVNLANHYVAQGYKISLIVFRNVGPYREDVNKLVDILDLKVTRTRYAFFRLLKTLKKIQPDTVLSVVRDANIAVGLTRLFYSDWHCVYREANTMDTYEGRRSISHKVYKLFMRVAYKKADVVIANSGDTKRDLLKHGLVNDNKCFVVSNPVLPPNFETLSNDSILHPWLVGKQYKTILNVGRLHKQKNQAMLMHAFAKAYKEMDSLRLIILGDGAEKESLDKLSADLNVSNVVQIIEFQKNPFPFYKHADLFILSSKWEGFGNVLVEALACGTTVISTNCPGGPKDILENGKYGVLVKNDDPEAMAFAILKNFTINESDGKKADGNICRGKSFSVDVIAKKYLYYIEAPS